MVNKILAAALCGLNLFGGLAHGHPHSHPLDLPFEMTEEHHEFLRRNIDAPAGGYFPVQGVPQTVIHPRQEIRSLISDNPNQFSLFILAMQKWQAQPQNKSTGYYQIAGIHGVPRQDWNDIPQCAACGGTDGYCTHVSVLFPPWHRAYMALFEQVLFGVVENIANAWPTNGVKGGPTRAAMQKAASTFRMPYWDWARKAPTGQHVLPGSISGNIISVQSPTGEITIQNPLYRHQFQSSSDLVYGPFVNWDFTIRYPTNDSADAVSQEGLAVSAFDNIQGSLQDQIYQLMTSCTDFLHFSNINGGSSPTSCSNSIEGIHDTVHQTAGGPGTSTVKTGGDMTYLSLAGFDPVFWLHHANVDRFFAMWQTLHPSSYGATQTMVSATWTYPTGSVQGPNSPLKPFTKNKAGTFWTTNTVKDWKEFHYTYPEFLSGGSKAQIASYVNEYYGPSATAPSAAKRTVQPDAVANADTTTTAAASTATPSATSTSLPDPFTAVNGSTFQYVANIKTPRNALSGSYFVFLFDGTPVIDDPSKWLFDDNLIGPMGVLSQSNMVGTETIVKGSIPLTRTLQSAVNNGTLADLTEINVSAYLTKNLEWRIAGPQGQEIDPSSLNGFEVGVFASTSSALNSVFELPQWTDFFPLESITKGKPGGLGGLLNALGGLIPKIGSELGQLGSELGSDLGSLGSSLV